MSVVLGLLPDLLQWLPEIAGATGAGGALLGLVPGLRKYAMIALAGLLALSLIGLFWYRSEYTEEVAGRLADKAAARAQVLEVQQQAAALSDELVIQQAAAMAHSSTKAGTYVAQIRAAPDGDRRRVGSRGVRDVILGDDRRPPALGGAPAAVPGPGAGARP